MRYSFIKRFTVATLCMFFSQHVFAGAWVPEVGSGYQKLGFNYFEATDFFGDNEGFEEFTNESITYYFEVGIHDKVALFGSIPFQDLSQTTSGIESTSSGLGDVELGVRYQWQADPFVVSTSFTFKAPYLYDEDDALPLGNGQEDYEARVLIGKSLGDFGYFGVEAGYRLRSNSPSDEYRYLLEYGFSPNENLYFRTKLDGIESVGNASTSADAFGNLAVPPEFDLGKLELSAGWNFGPARDRSQGRWGVEFTYTRDLYGDQTLEGETFQVGFTFVN